MTKPLSSFFSSSSAKTPSNSWFLQTILKRGRTPTTKHVNLFVLFLSQSHRYRSVAHFLSQMQLNHIEGNSETFCCLTWALVKLDKFQETEAFLRTRMAKVSNLAKARIWDSVIQGYCVRQKDPEKAFSALKDCLSSCGIVPSSYTVCSLVHSFSSRGMLDRAVAGLELIAGGKKECHFINFVCSSVISGFCKTGKPQIAVDLFDIAKRSGVLRPNLVTYTALVCALCDLGKVDQIEGIVGVMEEEGLALDVVFYSCWAHGHIRNGVLAEAFRKNRQMLEKGVAADVISYTSLMDGFSRVENVKKTAGFIAKMGVEGLKPNTVTHTAIILGLCRQGKFEEALALFEAIKDQGAVMDEYLYATLLDSVCRKGDFELVQVLLGEMEKKGISPSVVTHNIIINGLCQFGRTSEADDFSKGIPGDVFTYSTLLNGYIREGNVEGVYETKSKFENCGLKMDVVMCNVLIKATFMVGAFEDAHALYKRMPDLDLTANSNTYYALISGFLKAGRVEEALEIFDELRDTSILSAACYSCIVEGLCKRGLVDMAFEVFLEQYQKNLAADLGYSIMLIEAIFKKQGADGVLKFVSKIKKLTLEDYIMLCDRAIYYLCKKGHAHSAYEVYLSMGISSSLVSCKSFFLILKGLTDEKSKIGRPLLGVLTKNFGLFDDKLRKMLVQYVCLQDVKIGIYLVNKLKAENLKSALPVSVFKVLMEDGRILDAYQLVVGEVDTIPSLDLVDFTMLMDGLFKGGHVSQALSIYSFVRKKAISLNIVFYNTVINGLCHQGRLTEAFRLYDSLERIGLAPSEVTFGTLINALCREQFLHDAELLLGRMILCGHIPSTRAYNSLIDSYSKIGKFDVALKVFKELEMHGQKADEFTVTALINAYAQKGDMEGAIELYSEFKSRGILPDYLGFLYLVRGLIAKGRMEEAQSILRQMLQVQPIVELIDKIDSEVGPESLHTFLVQLCEQGNITGASTILNEIGCMIHPSRRFQVDNDSSQEQSQPFDCDASKSDAATSIVSTGRIKAYAGALEERDMEEALNCARGSQFLDFDSLYSLVCSLCSSGEVQKANQILKETFR